LIAASGESSEAIGKLLNRTTSAVRQRARTLQIKLARSRPGPKAKQPRIPHHFTLRADRCRMPCHVVWRKEKRIGVVFEYAAPHSMGTLSKFTFIHCCWNDCPCGFWGLRLFGIDGFSDRRKNYRMGQAERPTCPHCGAFLLLALPLGGKGLRTFQCFECDGLDPLKTEKASGWLKGELHPPK